MVLGVLGLVIGLYAMVRRDRTWRTWVGLVAGALVVVSWLLFGVGELFSK